MVFDDIEKVKTMIYRRSDKFNETHENYFSKLYFMSTENLSGYLGNFDFSNKSVLTTGSSADQVLNLIAYGSNNIDHFDINPFVKYYYALKKAAILGLNPRNYLNFFNYQNGLSNRSVFNEKVYNKVSKNLDSDSKLFWDSIYDLLESSEIRDKLFFHDSMQKVNAISNNGYLNSGKYRLLRKKLEQVNVKFITENISNFPIDGKNYDYVLLSNIFDYLYNLLIILDDRELYDALFCYQFLLKRLTSLLKDDGIMFFHYFWQTEANVLYDKIKRFFDGNDHISIISFPNCHGKNNSKDSVMAYKKTL